MLVKPIYVIIFSRRRSNSLKTLKIPEATIVRLSVYSRFLKQLEKNDIITVSSGEIAEGVNGSSAQVRKDLAYFGEFGTRGVGYNVQDLNQQILKILGLTDKWNVIIVGAGNLGSALGHYNGFRERGFEIQAVFDNDLNKVGLKIGDVPIYPISQLDDVVKREKIQIGIVAVPPKYAQEVIDHMVRAGIKAILNFASKIVSVPDNVELRNVDLSVSLEILTFNLGSRNEKDA